jgi:hypothetical protein
MKLDMMQVITDLDKNPIMAPVAEGVRETPEPLTLRMVLVNCLVHPRNDTEKTTGEQKVEKFDLALTMKRAERFVDVTPTQVTMLKTLVNAVYGTIITGQVWEILNTKETP